MARPEGGSGRRTLDPRALLDELARHEVDFVVIGGFSLAAHGYVRATKDLNIVPSPAPPNLARLAAALDALEAEADVGDLSTDELDVHPDEDGLRAGGNWMLKTRFGRLDVMQDVPGLRGYGQLRGGAVLVGGVLYAGYEELISMKVASGREEDLRDVGALEAARRSVTNILRRGPESG
jgi:hypothetical protein